jgi:hypothetical protein
MALSLSKETATSFMKSTWVPIILQASGVLPSMTGPALMCSAFPADRLVDQRTHRVQHSPMDFLNTSR